MKEKIFIFTGFVSLGILFYAISGKPEYHAVGLLLGTVGAIFY